MTFSGIASAEEQVKQLPVTVKNFQRAESDLYNSKLAKQSGFGSLSTNGRLNKHQQDVMRMIHDTLYADWMFALDAGPVFVTLSDAGKRLMSLQTVTEDHYSPPARYAPVMITLTRKVVGARYVVSAAR